jgi:hypothetical protein
VDRITDLPQVAAHVDRQFGGGLLDRARHAAA